MTNQPWTQDSEPIGAVVFDAYGTLFDVASAARRLGADIQAKAGSDLAEALAAVWRTRQVEYTWLRSLMGVYEDFWHVTGEALDFALASVGLADPHLRARLMEQYLNLDAYPDAADALAALQGAGLRTAILSNGSPSMLAAAVTGARLRHHLDHVLSVDEVRIYKPHPTVYQLACDRLDLDRRRIAFVSANGWDAAGAAAFGFRVAWLNRAGAVPERLPARPEAEVTSLADLPGLLLGPGA